MVFRPNFENQKERLTVWERLSAFTGEQMSDKIEEDYDWLLLSARNNLVSRKCVISIRDEVERIRGGP